MQSKATSPDEYMAELPLERRTTIARLREIIKANLPRGFEEVMSYGMIGYVVPHEIYPEGYHCNPSLPLPFMNLASQKHYIALYHAGIYANETLHQWFTSEYSKNVPTKLDMGKSCIRFKSLKYIPYDLIGELCTKLTPHEWISIYEAQIKR